MFDDGIFKEEMKLKWGHQKRNPAGKVMSWQRSKTDICSQREKLTEANPSSSQKCEEVNFSCWCYPVCCTGNGSLIPDDQNSDEILLKQDRIPTAAFSSLSPVNLFPESIPCLQTSEHLLPTGCLSVWYCLISLSNLFTQLIIFNFSSSGDYIIWYL